MGLWAIAFAFAMPLGVYSGWGAVLAINLQEFEISALAAGWLGCAMTLIGCFAGVIIGAWADRFRGNMKGAILVCCAISTVAFLWFALIILGVVRGNHVALYLTGTVGGTFLNAPIPLFFELVRATHRRAFHLATPMQPTLSWMQEKMNFGGVCVLSTDYGDNLPNDCRGRRLCTACAANNNRADRLLSRVVYPCSRNLNGMDELADGVCHAGKCAAVSSNASPLQPACRRRPVCYEESWGTGLVWLLLNRCKRC